MIKVHEHRRHLLRQQALHLLARHSCLWTPTRLVVAHLHSRVELVGRSAVEHKYGYLVKVAQNVDVRFVHEQGLSVDHARLCSNM